MVEQYCSRVTTPAWGVRFTCGAYYVWHIEPTRWLLTRRTQAIYPVMSGGARLCGLAPGQHSSEKTWQRWAFASRWWHCVRFDQSGNRTQTSHGDSVVTTSTERLILMIFCSNLRHQCHVYNWWSRSYRSYCVWSVRIGGSFSGTQHSSEG